MFITWRFCLVCRRQQNNFWHRKYNDGTRLNKGFSTHFRAAIYCLPQSCSQNYLPRQQIFHKTSFLLLLYSKKNMQSIVVSYFNMCYSYNVFLTCYSYKVFLICVIPTRYFNVLFLQGILTCYSYNVFLTFCHSYKVF